MFDYYAVRGKPAQVAKSRHQEHEGDRESSLWLAEKYLEQTRTRSGRFDRQRMTYWSCMGEPLRTTFSVIVDWFRNVSNNCTALAGSPTG